MTDDLSSVAVNCYPFTDGHFAQREDDLSLILIEFAMREPLQFAGHQNDNTNNNNQRTPEDILLTCLKDAFSTSWQKGDGIMRLGCLGYAISFISELGSHCIFRYYTKSQKLTVDIQGSCKDDPTTLSCRSLEKFIGRICELTNATTLRPFERICSIPRCGSINNLFFTSDQRLIVRDFDKLIFVATTPFQRICIQRSPRFGNTLILDDFINISESDAAYNRAITGGGKELYKNKGVLILGGGDGGILNEVMKSDPGFVTMVEIDEVVVDASRRYLRGVCGDSLDNRAGPHHEIVIGDCFEYMEECNKNGTYFDYIISDLTDCPLVGDSEESLKNQGEFWGLTKKVVRLGLQLLYPGGRFLTHLVGIAAAEIIEEYEAFLKTNKLQFRQSIAFVPSFEEEWIFYTISKNADGSMIQ